MIFEVDAPIIKEALSTIKSTMTATELRKPEYANIEMHVEEDRVYLSLYLEDDLEFQVSLDGAEPILDGKVSIDINVLIDTIKPFGKDSPSLLFERDGAELQVDDGVTEPEIIILTEDNELEDGFRLEIPKESVSLNKEWFLTSLDIAKFNSRTTFLPATSGTYIQLDEDCITLRSFNLASMYESKSSLLQGEKDKEVLLGRNASSRLLRLLKGIKKDSVNLTIHPDYTYISTDSFVFKFPNLKDQKSIDLIKSLPFQEMSQATDSATIKVSELAKKLAQPKDEGFSFTIKNGEEIEISNANTIPIYPLKFSQRLIKKWKGTITMSLGLQTEGYPLVLTQSTDNTNSVFILAGLQGK